MSFVNFEVQIEGCEFRSDGELLQPTVEGSSSGACWGVHRHVGCTAVQGSSLLGTLLVSFFCLECTYWRLLGFRVVRSGVRGKISEECAQSRR